MGILVALLMIEELQSPKHLPWGGSDFVQYYVAWELIVEGKNPYDVKLAGPRQIQYGREHAIETYAPPWSLFLSFPFAAFSLPHAVVGFIILNLLLIFFCAYVWSDLLVSINLKSIAFVLFGIFFWVGCLSVIGFGQISVWPFAGISGWLWCLKYRRHFAAGLFLALIMVKPHTGLLPGLFAGLYTLRRRYWSTAVAFAFGLGIATAAITALRPSIWIEYVTAILSGTPPTHYYTATLDGWLRFHVSEAFVYITWPLWIAALLLTAIVAWKVADPRNDSLPNNAETHKSACLIEWSALSCLATIAFVPYAFQHDFVFMLPGYFLALGAWLGRRHRGRTAIHIWIAIYSCFMYMGLTYWTQDHFWIISWSGLGTTIWLLWDHLSLLTKRTHPAN